MCSALGQESKVLEAIKAGAKDFVVKPFQPDRVVDAIGKALAIRAICAQSQAIRRLPGMMSTPIVS